MVSADTLPFIPEPSALQLLPSHLAIGSDTANRCKAAADVEIACTIRHGRVHRAVCAGNAWIHTDPVGITEGRGTEAGTERARQERGPRSEQADQRGDLAETFFQG